MRSRKEHLAILRFQHGSSSIYLQSQALDFRTFLSEELQIANQAATTQSSINTKAHLLLASTFSLQQQLTTTHSLVPTFGLSGLPFWFSVCCICCQRILVSFDSRFTLLSTTMKRFTIPAVMASIASLVSAQGQFALRIFSFSSDQI